MDDDQRGGGRPAARFASSCADRNARGQRAEAAMNEQAVHILLVEDEEGHAKLVRHAFKSHAAMVNLTVAGSLEEARACLAESLPHLVIADLVLPDGQGIELLPAKGEHHLFPVVVMTGYGGEEVAVEAMKLGALDYVVKSEATLADMPRIAERALREWDHIIERRRAEEALREGEERYRRITEAVTDYIFTVRVKDGRPVETIHSSVCVAVTGYSPEEFAADPGLWIRMVPEEDRAVVLEQASRVLTGQDARPLEHRIVRKEGVTRWVRNTPVPHCDAQGKLLSYDGLIRDITERKEAEEALRLRVGQLAALSQASQTVTASLELDQVLARIVSLAGKVVPADYTDVVLVDEAGHIGRSTESLPGVPSIQYRIRDEGLTSWIVRARQAAVIDKVGEDGAITPDLGEGAPRFMNPQAVEIGIKSAVCLPLIAKGSLLGVVYLHSLRPGAFRGQLPLLTAFANQVAAAIENARLYEKVQRELAEHERMGEALRRRNRELAMLNRASGALISTLELDQVLATVLEEVRHLLGVVACSVWLADPETDELVCQQSTGPQKEIMRGWRLAPGQGLVGWVASSGESLIVPDAWADERYFRPVDEQTRLGLRSILSVPLRIKGDVIGVLQVVDTEVGRFDTTDLELLELLAATAAIAIENARLYEQARLDAETRSVLLQEVNHRVKNNLSAIVGLLYAERRHAEATTRGMEKQAVYHSIIQDLISRVQGLATVHGLLSASEWEPLLLSELTAQIIRSALQVLPRDKRASVDVTPSPVRVTSEQAHHLALVINELVTNTIKHGLQERDTVHISARIGLDDHKVLLEFRNDGPGYPEEVLRLERHDVGLDLVQKIVCKNLRGELSLYNDHGAVAVIRFEAKA